MKWQQAPTNRNILFAKVSPGQSFFESNVEKKIIGDETVLE